VALRSLAVKRGFLERLNPVATTLAYPARPNRAPSRGVPPGYPQGVDKS
jgi:hypothetical protein